MIYHRRFAFFESRIVPRRDVHVITFPDDWSLYNIRSRLINYPSMCKCNAICLAHQPFRKISLHVQLYIYIYILHLSFATSRRETPEWRSTCANLTERRNKTRTMPHWNSKCQRIFDYEWWTCLVVLVVRVFFSASCFSCSRAERKRADRLRKGAHARALGSVTDATWHEA